MAETVLSSPPEAANWIGGEWRPSEDGSEYEKVNPARPDEVVGRFSSSTVGDAEAAVAAAASAAGAWAALPAPQRGAILEAAAAALRARADAVARDMTTEMGKPLREARGEVGRGVQILRYFAGEALRPVGERFAQTGPGSVTTLRRPVGVVSLITPWNFPLAIPLWKLAPALVHGNAVVLKLANDAPRTGLHIASCFAEAGLPPGVLNVLTGSGSRIGGVLTGDPRVDAISFTGSVSVGHGIRGAATAAGKRVQLELGGQNPLIVMDDANLDAAVEAAFAGAFWSAGQKCTASRRMLVQDPVYDEFRERLLQRVASGRVGDPLDPETEVGPLVNAPQRDEVLAAIDTARHDGATLLAGGGTPDRPGFFIEPTVFEDVADDAMLSCEEVFGPVTALFRFGDLDEALERANAVRFGLSASIFTSSLASSRRFAERAEAGILHVNSQTAGAEIHVPFGGLKSSGWGPHEQGRASLEFYTDVVTLYEDMP